MSGSVNRRVDLGEVRNAVAVKAATGVDISGYRRVIDSSAVRKTLKDHGDAKVELARKPKQSRITQVDFERIPEIIRLSGSAQGRLRPSGRKPTTLTYKADAGRWTYTYVEEVRTGQKQVALKTMWKRKK